MTELALTNYSWGLKLATKQPSETLKELETKLSDILGTCERTWQPGGPYGYDPVHTGYEIVCNDRDKLIRALDLAKKALQPLDFEETQNNYEFYILFNSCW